MRRMDEEIGQLQRELEKLEGPIQRLRRLADDPKLDASGVPSDCGES